jgi:CheY-like chemotaxis protein
MNQSNPSKHIVLYADDDYDDLELLTDSFFRYGNNIDVVKAFDGFEALSYLKNLSATEPSPCLIILDLNMPRLDGMETLVRIKSMERFEHVPVVVFTTSSSERERTLAVEGGAAAFVTKPVSDNHLQQIVQHFLSFCSDEVKNNTQVRLR